MPLVVVVVVVVVVVGSLVIIRNIITGITVVLFFTGKWTALLFCQGDRTGWKVLILNDLSPKEEKKSNLKLTLICMNKYNFKAQVYHS